MEQRNDLIPTLEALYAQNGCDDPGPIALFGGQDEGMQEADVFNDVRGIWLRDAKKVYLCVATTNPGRHATEKKEGGAGHMAYGYHEKIWVFDTHAPSNPSFAHEGLCQRPLRGCGEIKFWRDVDREYVYKDKYPIESSNAVYMNWHRASFRMDVQVIGDYGEGCQVAQNHSDHEQQDMLIKAVPEVLATRRLDAKGITWFDYKFSYLLVRKEELGL
jgi:hypothetical protein